MGSLGRRVGVVLLLAVCCGAGVRGMADDEPANPGEVVECDADGTVLVRYAVDAEGRKHGMYRRWHRADVLAEESMWKAGQRHGATKHYDETGTLRLAEEYRSDELQGPRRVFDESGTLLEQAAYVRGQRHGPFKAWHGNRRLRLVTAYRNGLLEGKYQTWDESGSVVIRTTYKHGLLDGSYEVFDGKTKLTEQEWEAGLPRKVDGVVPFPRTQAHLKATLAKILAGETQLPTDELLADRELARRQLMAYRFLMDVPYDIRLDDGYTSLAQAASELCAAIGKITHTPDNPGWPAERFDPAAKGAASCNLHQGNRACTSVRGYMDDSDPTNIDRVGHRCWCLSPPMAATGFGHTNGFTAMWAFDKARKPEPDIAFISVPPAGYMPAAWMGAHWAWSVGLSSKHFDAPQEAAIVIEVVPVGVDFLPTGPALPLEAKYVKTESVGLSYLLIFRPVDLQLEVGLRWRISVDGLTWKGKPRPLRWFTELVDIPYESPRLALTADR